MQATLAFDYSSDWSRLDNLVSEVCVWLAFHPRITAALVCAVCIMPMFWENPR